MANTTAIDELVDPQAIAQIVNLKTESKSLKDEMIQLLQTAIKLNAELGGSTPATFAKNLKAANDATGQLIANNDKIIANEQKKLQAQEAAVNKYLILLSKQQAERDKADAKEIAAAEKKATKLQAIAEKSAADQARKANVQFPAGQSNSNPVTTDSGNVRYEPIITGQEDMTSASTQATAALNAETSAMALQQEGVESLTVAQRANIEMLLELQAERTANATELKELNVVDAVTGERVVFLTAEQLRLKTAIADVNVELARQAKEANSVQGSINQLTISNDLLRASYYNGMTAEERASESGQKMLVQIKSNDVAIKELKLATGDTTKEVGAYEKAIAKATNGTQLAAQAVNIATRSIVRMIVQFALFGVILQAAEWLYEYIKALNIFNPVATEAEQRQKALVDAFSSGDYTKGLENIEKLKADLDLANKGFADGNVIIDEYNNTIGKTFGYVDTLNDAQQGFINNSKDYIKTLYLEAAAQANLADASKFAAETEVKNQKLRQEIVEIKQNGIKGMADVAFHLGGANTPEDVVNDINKTIKENEKREDEFFKNSLSANERFYTDLDAIKKAHGVKSGGKSGKATDIETLQNQIENQRLEREKLTAQERINNEKLSYSTRLSAVEDFYKASKGIADNNEKLATNGIKLSADQKLKIEGEYSNQLLALQITRDNQLKTLRDKQYKQDQEILKNNIEKQRDLFKAVSEDPNQSYDMKLIALDIYHKKSQQLINANYKEQIKEAGKNGESIKLAEQQKAKSVLELDTQTAADRLKIQKENLAKILEQTKESEQDQLDTLQNGANLASRALIQAKENKENALSLARVKGKVSEKKYNEELIAINDQFAIDRIAQEIAVQNDILAIKEGHRDATALRMKIDGSSPDEINKFISGANKDIQPTTNKIAELGGQLIGATARQTIDNTKSKEEEKKEIQDQIFEDSKKSVELINGLVDKGYENQISKLEKIGQLIDENANIQKAAIDRETDTQSNKARRLAELDAETASKHKANQEKINAEKSKEAKADKAAAIAKIIIETAESIVKASPNPFLIALAAGLGASQLAVAIATPIPAFAKGGFTPGGRVVVGEKGIEHGRLPSGQEFYTPGVATIMNLPKGTKITPHHMLPETPKWISTSTNNQDVVDGLNRVEKAVSKQAQPRGTRVSGWLTEQRKAESWNSYSSNHFK